MSPFTFNEHERLRSKKQIDLLFRSGRSIQVSPLRVIWTMDAQTGASPARMMVSVSKRNFPRAVDRNRIKRRIREAYRLQKHTLYEILSGMDRQCLIAIIFAGKEIAGSGEIRDKITLAIQRLKKELNRLQAPGVNPS
jgi:ribonuclease P protein component